MKIAPVLVNRRLTFQDWSNRLMHFISLQWLKLSTPHSSSTHFKAHVNCLCIAYTSVYIISFLFVSVCFSALIFTHLYNVSTHSLHELY